MRNPSCREKIGLIGSIVRWWRTWRMAPAGSDIADPAKDAGLLPRRMALLGIDANALRRVEPELLHDLEGLCMTCECPGLCGHHLKCDPANPAWEEYCPNSVVLTAIGALRWFSRPRREP